MFKALLLATVAGVGATNAPVPASELAARSNNPPSYLCSSVNKKCTGPKAKASVTAYCSSLLKVPVVTKTKRTTVVSTGSTTITKTVATITQPASVVTSTITSCGPPVTTPAAGGEESAPEGASKREAEPQQAYNYGQNTVHKPSCFPSYKRVAEASSACKCLSITPSTTTVTSTIKMAVKSTITIPATSTVTQTATTTYVLPTEQSYAVADQNGNYFQRYIFAGPGGIKDIRSGVGFSDDNISDAILFQLNDGNLIGTDEEGVASELRDEDDVSDDEDDIRVVLASPEQIFFGEYKPISCSISYEPTDNTCPLVCQYSSPADRNLAPQGIEPEWLLGPPNTVSESSTYKTYAVSRTDRGRGGGAQRRTTRRRV
ncbi:hypothetical protein Slin15195_G054630 [Septoria linicola]|uniref:Uncharacterized protein n=1 Tax=Septoria linicola TaxID=215465 RepID=A0A9Q9AMQ4_9PEZI|nr:hypothetical protein Slin15195_G054630 [Septoria linicola]